MFKLKYIRLIAAFLGAGLVICPIAIMTIIGLNADSEINWFWFWVVAILWPLSSAGAMWFLDQKVLVPTIKLDEMYKQGGRV